MLSATGCKSTPCHQLILLGHAYIRPRHLCVNEKGERGDDMIPICHIDLADVMDIANRPISLGYNPHPLDSMSIFIC
jgi:hypothetical protein